MVVILLAGGYLGLSDWRVEQAPEHARREAPGEDRRRDRSQQSASLVTEPATVLAAAPAPSIRGMVSSVSGKALAGAQVCLSSARRGSNAAPLCVTTERGGAFRIEAAASPGDLIIANLAGYDGQTRRVASESEEAVDFVLGPARAATVHGVVVDAAGGPVGRALVLAQRAGASDAVVSAWSDENGRFGLALDPGAATVSAHAEAYATSSVEIDAPTEGVTLVLAATSTLIGVVVEDASGRLVPGVAVSAYARSPVHRAGLQVTTDAEGQFRFAELHAGAYDLRAEGEQWGGGQAAATVGVAEVSAPVVLRVRPATTVTGVIRAQRVSCPGAALLLRGSTAVLGAEADANGSVSISGVLPGRYEATVRCPTAVALQEQLEVGGAPLHREWELSSGATVRGRVERASGQPVEGSVVQMSLDTTPGADNERARSVVDCVSEPRGEFVCRGVEPGRYLFSIGRQSPITVGSIAVDAAALEPPDVILRMPPTASILVKLDSGESAPPSSFHVRARNSAGSESLPERTAEGHLFREVPLGTYVVYLGPTAQIPEGAPRVTLSADSELARLTLVPPSTLDIAGVVLDGSGQPVPELWLHAESAAAQVFEQVSGVPALTNERGEFLLRGLIPGSYDLVSTGREPQPLLASVSAGARGIVLRLLD